MSLSIDPKNGVRLNTVRKRGLGLAAVIIVLEAVFSFFLYLSLAEKVFVVIPAGATAAIPELISYQGLLTDTSSNPLGGSAGALYCFRYSIWDVPTGGTTSTDQLWPSVAAGNGTTTVTVSTTTVTNGVFSDKIGRVDSLAGLDFETATTYYLDVAVNTATSTGSTCTGSWSELLPRQQIVSDAWSQAAQSVDGNLMRTVYTSTSTGMVYLGTGTGTVQIGLGTGVGYGQETLLSLDHVNATGSQSEYFGDNCNQDGTLWYDTVLKRAMVCENGTMGMISNATTTIATVGTNGTTTLISSGNVLLSGASNVTLSQGGNTISFSAPNGGTSLSNLYWPNDILASTMSSSIIGYVHYVPFRLEQSLAASRAAIIVSIAGASTANTSVRSNQVTLQIGLFTRTGSTLQTVASGSQIYSWSWASTTNTSVIANITGLKRMSVPITVNVAPGDYWYGVWVNQVNTTSASGAVSYLAIGGYNAPLNFLGNVGSASNSSNELVPGLGIYSNATTNALITSVNITDIKSAGTTGWAAEPWILFTNFDVN